MKRCLVIVDVQRDFCPGGALPVPEGDQVVPVINRLLRRFDRVAATQDWHPPGHLSFAANHPGRKPGEVIQLAGLEQVLWPVHCVQHTPGAEFHPDLDRSRIQAVFRKGVDPEVDSYSGFFDNGRRRSTGLDEYLRREGVEEIYICGLATDYCVRWTALDAVRLGLRSWVIEDACRGVELRPGDVAAAWQEMIQAGVHLILSQNLLA
jgi:nicotinamidase/pyrazinamidase